MSGKIRSFEETVRSMLGLAPETASAGAASPAVVDLTSPQAPQRPGFLGRLLKDLLPWKPLRLTADSGPLWTPEADAHARMRVEEMEHSALVFLKEANLSPEVRARIQTQYLRSLFNARGRAYLNESGRAYFSDYSCGRALRDALGELGISTHAIGLDPLASGSSVPPISSLRVDQPLLPVEPGTPAMPGDALPTDLFTAEPRFAAALERAGARETFLADVIAIHATLKNARGSSDPTQKTEAFYRGANGGPIDGQDELRMAVEIVRQIYTGPDGAMKIPADGAKITAQDIVAGLIASGKVPMDATRRVPVGMEFTLERKSAPPFAKMHDVFGTMLGKPSIAPIFGASARLSGHEREVAEYLTARWHTLPSDLRTEFTASEALRDSWVRGILWNIALGGDLSDGAVHDSGLAQDFGLRARQSAREFLNRPDCPYADLLPEEKARIAQTIGERVALDRTFTVRTFKGGVPMFTMDSLDRAVQDLFEGLDSSLPVEDRAEILFPKRGATPELMNLLARVGAADGARITHPLAATLVGNPALMRDASLTLEMLRASPAFAKLDSDLQVRAVLRMLMNAGYVRADGSYAGPPPPDRMNLRGAHLVRALGELGEKSLTVNDLPADLHLTRAADADASEYAREHERIRGMIEDVRGGADVERLSAIERGSLGASWLAEHIQLRWRTLPEADKRAFVPDGVAIDGAPRQFVSAMMLGIERGSVSDEKLKGLGKLQKSFVERRIREVKAAVKGENVDERAKIVERAMRMSERQFIERMTRSNGNAAPTAPAMTETTETFLRRARAEIAVLDFLHDHPEYRGADASLKERIAARFGEHAVERETSPRRPGDRMRAFFASSVVSIEDVKAVHFELNAVDRMRESALSRGADAALQQRVADQAFAIARSDPQLKDRPIDVTPRHLDAIFRNLSGRKGGLIPTRDDAIPPSNEGRGALFDAAVEQNRKSRNPAGAIAKDATRPGAKDAARTRTEARELSTRPERERESERRVGSEPRSRVPRPSSRPSKLR